MKFLLTKKKERRTKSLCFKQQLFNKQKKMIIFQYTHKYYNEIENGGEKNEGVEKEKRNCKQDHLIFNVHSIKKTKNS